MAFVTGCNDSAYDSDSDTTEISEELQAALDYAFDPVNSSSVIHIKKCGINCFEVHKYDSDNNTELIKTRSEAGNDGWIYWGVVSGLISAKKMADEMEKLCDGKCYELKMEPYGDDRKVYHRPCK